MFINIDSNFNIKKCNKGVFNVEIKIVDKLYRCEIFSFLLVMFLYVWF